jgi:hypothetical protein
MFSEVGAACACDRTTSNVQAMCSAEVSRLVSSLDVSPHQCPGTCCIRLCFSLNVVATIKLTVASTASLGIKQAAVCQVLVVMNCRIQLFIIIMLPIKNW